MLPFVNFVMTHSLLRVMVMVDPSHKKGENSSIPRLTLACLL